MQHLSTDGAYGPFPAGREVRRLEQKGLHRVGYADGETNTCRRARAACIGTEGPREDSGTLSMWPCRIALPADQEPRLVRRVRQPEVKDGLLLFFRPASGRETGRSERCRTLEAVERTDGIGGQINSLVLIYDLTDRGADQLRSSCLPMSVTNYLPTWGCRQPLRAGEPFVRRPCEAVGSRFGHARARNSSLRLAVAYYSVC